MEHRNSDQDFSINNEHLKKVATREEPEIGSLGVEKKNEPTISREHLLEMITDAGEYIDYKVRIECKRGSCGEVTLYPEYSTGTFNATYIPLSSDSSQDIYANASSYACGFLDSQEEDGPKYCNKTFRINVKGGAAGAWRFKSYAESDYYNEISTNNFQLMSEEMTGFSLSTGSLLATMSNFGSASYDTFQPFTASTLLTCILWFMNCSFTRPHLSGLSFKFIT